MQKIFSGLMLILVTITLTHCSESTYPRKSGAEPSENTLVGPTPDSSFFVATSQLIDPEGKTITFPGRPLDVCFNKDESLIAVKNMNTLVFFDAVKKDIIQTLRLPSGGNTFLGLSWTGSGQNEKVWVTDTRGFLMGAARSSDNVFRWTDSINLPKLLVEDKGGLDPGGLTVIDKKGPYPGGFFIDESSGYCYVALNRNNSICIVNMRTKKVEKEIAVGVAPFTVVKKGNKLYVSNFGGRRPLTSDKIATSSGSPIVVSSRTGVASSGTVSVIDLNRYKVVKEISVGLHPGCMVLSNDQKKLYVANSNSDNISVIDTYNDQFLTYISAKPADGLPLGSSPNAIAISPNDSVLYICNGGNNAIGVFDLKENILSGFIPAGWYPGAILINRAGDQLVVANIKGIGGRNQRPDRKGLNSHDHMGSITFLSVPGPDKLKGYNEKAYRTMRVRHMETLLSAAKKNIKPVPVPVNLGEPSVFKHVLYIIKENRTYDQVFGDIKRGNGDSSLCLFGSEVTPNAHALAEEFVLLDNTYCNGVNSADGHQWTNEGIATDYIERSFGGFVRSYPCCAGEDPLAYASSGFIWDKVLQGGYSFRDYGEFVDAEIEPKGLKWTDHYNNFVNGRPMAQIKAKTELTTLAPYICKDFIGFPETVPDIYRADVFIKELKAFEKNNNLPNLMMMLLPNDHTAGTNENYPTPRAMVADNDLALGRIVEAVSNSKFWKETVIFVIEDDAQAGLDHVDGRRTVAFCISPYTKRNSVISTMYNQNSILRTIQLIFGLTPMTQFDLLANPMYDCFTGRPDFTPYKARPNRIPLNEMNPKLTTLKGKQSYWAKKSMEIPLEDYDLSDGGLLSRILWYSVKGYDSHYPEHLELKK